MHRTIRPPSKKSKPGRSSVFVSVMAGLAFVAALALFPTPFFLLSPGTAVDISRHVAVEGHMPAKRQFFLTDVAVARASLLLLAGGLFPGMRIVKHEFLVPAGQSVQTSEHLQTVAMNDSQRIAAYVAERAAGLVPGAPRDAVRIAAFTDASRAKALLRVGDQIVRVGAVPIAHSTDVAHAIEAAQRNDRARVEVARGPRKLVFDVPTIRTASGPRLGVAVSEGFDIPTLPVPVHFTLDNIEGGSGGLMFALTIYAELKDDRSDAIPIAGTGTISPDGTVGPIEGTQQKIIAAKRAGARLFLVPRENYADVRGESGITVVPVATFAEALAAEQRAKS